MSRVGKKPIPLPAGVKINIGAEMEVTGPKGKLTVPIPSGVRIEKNDSTLEVKRDSDAYAALHGLTRALASNAVVGVSAGFTRELDIVGIGYRAEVKGKIATFTLGYSHTIEFLLPDGVDLSRLGGAVKFDALVGIPGRNSATVLRPFAITRSTANNPEPSRTAGLRGQSRSPTLVRARTAKGSVATVHVSHVPSISGQCRRTSGKMAAVHLRIS